MNPVSSYHLLNKISMTIGFIMTKNDPIYIEISVTYDNNKKFNELLRETNP